MHIPKDGDYTVYVKYTSNTDRATNAPYTIEHTGGKTTKYVNQQVNGGQWVDIGTYTFRTNRTWSITLSNNANNMREKCILVTDVKEGRIFYKYLSKEHINDAVNGVWVRGGREHQSKLHSRRAYMLLFDRLKDVQSRSELIEELNKLTNDIIHYRFP